MGSKALYFEDAFQWAFEARVSGVKTDEAGAWLSLDQTAFYPEGGGQPGDSGRLLMGDREWAVLDTRKDADGTIWHRIKAPAGDLPAPGTDLAGEVDWARRLDHMQQHTGEHIIAASLFLVTGGFTHGLHIGHEISTIDVTLPDGKTKLEQAELNSIEALANARIQADDPIRCYFPGDDEMGSLPLRKDPTMQENIRVCLIGDYEGVACGGTHLDRAGKVGLVKLLNSEPARGKMRLSFLCGQRAMAHYALVYRALSGAAALLSAKEEEVPARLQETLQKAAKDRQELAALKRRNTLAKIPALLDSALTLRDGSRVVQGELEPDDQPALEALAGELVSRPRVIALLAVPREKGHSLLFARSEDVDVNLSDFLKSTGAKGGGRPEFARGASADPLPWEAAKVMAPHL